MRSRKKPPALRPGQTIGLVAPASALPEPEKLPVAIERLEALGFCVKVAESCESRHGYFAGCDALRADDINRMFCDDTVDAVLCARGGYGATRILGRLNYDAIAANPKVFSGYSDITALHSAIGELSGLVTFHGIMAVSDMGQTCVDSFSADGFFRAVGNPTPLGILQNPGGCTLETIVPGCATGQLIGGNLSLLVACLGTPYAFDFDGALLFIEEVNEKTYAVDRMLTHLKSAGAFDRCAGVVLGDFCNCQVERPDAGLTLAQVFEEVLGDLFVPVLSGLTCGHCTPKLTLPFGVSCELNSEKGTLTVLESAVR